METFNVVQYMHTAHYYRGYVINEFNNLEKTIERLLANYFLDDKDEQKKSDLIQIVFDRMNFEIKRTSLKSLADKAETRAGFVRTNKNGFKNTKLFNEIRRLNDHRNYFAHYYLAIVEKDNGKIIGLSEFRDGHKTTWYTISDIDNLIDGIYRAIKELMVMFP